MADIDLVRDMGAHLMRDDVFHDTPNAAREDEYRSQTKRANRQQLAFRAAPASSRIIDQSGVKYLSAEQTGLVYDISEDVSQPRNEREHERMMQGFENMAALQRTRHAPDPHTNADDTSRRNYLDRSSDSTYRDRIVGVVNRLRIALGGIEHEEKDTVVRGQGVMHDRERDHRRDDMMYKTLKKTNVVAKGEIYAPMSHEQQMITDTHRYENLSNRVHLVAHSDITPHNMKRADDTHMHESRQTTGLMLRLLRDTDRLDQADDHQKFAEITHRARKQGDILSAPVSNQKTADDHRMQNERRAKSLVKSMMVDMDQTASRNGGNEFQLTDGRQARAVKLSDMSDFESHLTKFINTVVTEETRHTHAPNSRDLRDEGERSKVIAQTMNQLETYQVPAPVVRNLEAVGVAFQERKSLIDGREKIDERFTAQPVDRIMREFDRLSTGTDVDNNRPTEGFNRGAKFTGIDAVKHRNIGREEAKR